MVLGVVRHLLTLVGGYLVAHGTMDQLQVTQGVGAICTLIAIGWSVAEKRRASRGAPSVGVWGSPVLIGTAIALLGAILIGTGCASPSKAVTADIRLQFGTNVVTVSQPKDTVIEALEFEPETGRLTLRGYQSTASAAALAAMEAQNQIQGQVFQRGLDVIELLATRAAQSQGIPMGPATSGTARSAPLTGADLPSALSVAVPGWTVPLVWNNATSTTNTANAQRPATP